MAKQKAAAAPAPAAPAVLAEEWLLANGRRCRFEMPDMLAFAAGDIPLANTAQADIYELLYKGDLPSVDDVAIINDKRRRTRGLYALFALVAIDPDHNGPILALDDDEREPWQIGPRAIAWGDLGGCHAFFRFGPSIFSAPAAHPGSPAGQDAAPAGDGIPPGAE